MSQEIRDLIPNVIWKHFADINAVPRPSKKEEKIIQFMVDFGHRLKLETYRDDVGNVIIKKPATDGMQNKKPIVMQSHLDMVHQKNNDTHFDFDTQGIQMYVDGDWVKAKGTTLGADNGIGVATIMAILESTDIAHPDMEALFTIDEETGMTGAMGLQSNLLKGQILLNLDTEEDDEINVGCAGGIDLTATQEFGIETIDQNTHTGYTVSVKGLMGGHSGLDIHKGHGNAIKLLNRILYNLDILFDAKLSSYDGGSVRNAIPRECTATIAVPNQNIAALEEHIQNVKDLILSEYKSVESDIMITYEKTTCPSQCISTSAYSTLVHTIYAAHNGVYRMSPDINDLVETSNNVAKVTLNHGKVSILCLSRSSVESSKTDLTNTLTSTFTLAGFDVKTSGSYPGWTPNIGSSILKVMSALYKKMYGHEAKIVACHAGLECGLLGTKYPMMDMISYGPTIKGAHSPDERVNIPSVAKYWDYTIEILKNIPDKE